MFDRTYQPGRVATPVGVPCADCAAPATHERGGMPLCLSHFLVGLQSQQRAEWAEVLAHMSRPDVEVAGCVVERVAEVRAELDPTWRAPWLTGDQ